MSSTKKKAKGNIAEGGVQHFLKNINEKVPDAWKKKHPMEKPKRGWEIEYVYGYSGDRHKSCLVFGSNNNEILYPAAALGIK